MKVLIFLVIIWTLGIALFLYLHYLSNQELEANFKKQELTIDSLSKLQKCYCTKLQFLDTLTDKEIDLAFKKSRGRIL